MRVGRAASREAARLDHLPAGHGLLRHGRLVPEHDPAVLDLEDRRSLSAGAVAGVPRPLVEVERVVDGEWAVLVVARTFD